MCAERAQAHVQQQTSRAVWATPTHHAPPSQCSSQVVCVRNSCKQQNCSSTSARLVAHQRPFRRACLPMRASHGHSWQDSSTRSPSCAGNRRIHGAQEETGTPKYYFLPFFQDLRAWRVLERVGSTVLWRGVQTDFQAPSAGPAGQAAGAQCLLSNVWESAAWLLHEVGSAGRRKCNNNLAARAFSSHEEERKANFARRLLLVCINVVILDASRSPAASRRYCQSDGAFKPSTRRSRAGYFITSELQKGGQGGLPQKAKSKLQIEKKETSSIFFRLMFSLNFARAGITRLIFDASSASLANWQLRLHSRTRRATVAILSNLLTSN